MLKVATCDRQGAVYLDTDRVYRVIRQGQENPVCDVLKKLDPSAITGMVSTEICPAHDLPDGLAGSDETLVLKHSRISRISYAHEWCASMLKDCALFHLQLSQQLLSRDLYLKDAHPWNILFEDGQFVFVDFTSVVSSDSLLAEDYLRSNQTYRQADEATRLAMVTSEVFERMYLPYFLYPLFAYAYGRGKLVPKLLLRTTLNASTSTITARHCMPKIRVGRSLVKNLYGLLRSNRRLHKMLASLRHDRNVAKFYSQVKQLVSCLQVAGRSSAYASYYSEKGEDQDVEYSEQWNAKQKAVHAAINSAEINTVLDVACNTGWFALMAEKLGKSVVAFDIDEGCIEYLYNRIKMERLRILPLVMNLTDLTSDRYSIYDGNKVLINARERLKSDSLLALGIIHHLVLGLGLSFDEVLKMLPYP